MHYYGHSLRRFLWVSCLIFSSICNPANARQDNAVHVIASVKPVAALLEVVMDGVAKPELLLSGHDSPHHFSLRPSQLRELKADMMFYISDNYEYFLNRPLKQIRKEKSVMELVKAPGLELLNLRNPNSETANSPSEIDPHFWLSPGNVKILARYMAETLAARYPEHAVTFRKNAEAFVKQMDGIEKNTEKALQLYKGKGFAALHDGYQYLEKTYGIKMAAALSDPSFHQLSPRAMQKIRKQARKGEISCLVGEPQEGRDVISSLSRQLNIPAIEVDPEGISLDGSGAAYWEGFYADMAQKFINCFKDSDS